VPPDAGRQPAVRVEDLERRFGDFVAVDRVSFEVAPGEIFGFLGPNGSGKSTTIRLLTGLLLPTGGRGWVAGHDLSTAGAAIKRVIGYMSQRFSLYEDLTVGQNLEFYGGVYGVPAPLRAERTRWALAMAGLAGHTGDLARDLAAGWRQRLALACAVLHEPRVLFLDEPTSGVDPISRRAFWDLIHAMARKGVTVFVTTHYMDEAEYCDRLALLHQGRIVALGAPDELRRTGFEGELLEIAVDRPVEALARLGAEPGVREVGLFGASLRASVADAAAAAPALRAALEASGLRVERLDPAAPTLEDVFVSLIAAQGRDRAGRRGG
jgi:ABC-2 type transport system ATP-binding protein